MGDVDNEKIKSSPVKSVLFAKVSRNFDYELKRDYII